MLGMVLWATGQLGTVAGSSASAQPTRTLPVTPSGSAVPPTSSSSTTTGAPRPATTPTPTHKAKSTTATPPSAVTSHRIVSVEIPAIGVKAKASGGIVPTASSRCEGSGVAICYDPPVLTEVAWGSLCALPSIPSHDTVCLFGHSNRFYPDRQVFNDLPKLRTGDKIIVTTDTAVFIYRMDKNPIWVNFNRVSESDWVWAKVPNRLVAITCTIGSSSYTGATVAEATIVSVRPLG